MNEDQNADLLFDEENVDIADEMVEGTIAVESYHPYLANSYQIQLPSLKTFNNFDIKSQDERNPFMINKGKIKDDWKTEFGELKHSPLLGRDLPRH